MQIKAIAIRAQKGAAMQLLTQAEIDEATGVQGDAGRRPGKFMVTLLSQESWNDACVDVGQDLPWTTRRANILVSGYRFSADDVGKVIHLGDCQLKVTRETDPCDLMDAACPGLKAALKPDWRGGVRAQVIAGGVVVCGESAHIA
ncbi:MOSC domain-containing protein [Reinekea sp. G2M2-21]|uniref:MOSC domain-containing protein n=1 Tax=Reinekea sp. G2M2-21 TaxID=2788942 RepID=UPI0018AB252E|nr:MOSC domain-containing protein [Reinekea sp. G2M2-21]